MATPTVNVTVLVSSDTALANDLTTLLSAGNNVLYVVPLTTSGGSTPILIAYVPQGT